MKIYQISLFVLAFIFSINLVHSQNEYGEIKFIKNRKVFFNFETLDKIQFGDNQIDILELRINFCDPDFIYGWELYLGTNTKTHFEPGYASSLIPISKLLITSYNNNGDLICEDEPLISSNPGILIGNGAKPVNPGICVTDTIILSIQCEGLSAYEMDQYFLYLSVQLISKP